jgi:hypothetical protein
MPLPEISEQTMEGDLRYPIGKFERVQNVTPEQRGKFIATIDETPTRLAAAVA